MIKNFWKENGNFLIIAVAIIIGIVSLIFVSRVVKESVFFSLSGSFFLPIQKTGGVEEARALRHLKQRYYRALAGSVEKEELDRALANKAMELYHDGRIDFNYLLTCVEYRLVPWPVLLKHNRPLALRVRNEFLRYYRHLRLDHGELVVAGDRINFFNILNRLMEDGVVSWEEISVSP
ncbi:MAG: hypothetical protein NTV48_01975, partial [Candidatus Vogelbacteria bacterium]|nr:hypothetical protein [Candidatus Vogelbacteria bacterium]